ncbi:hypothetical protein [Vibrio phage LV6]|nr:hypothetical protein [Vibrio phage LV6]
MAVKIKPRNTETNPMINQIVARVEKLPENLKQPLAEYLKSINASQLPVINSSLDRDPSFFSRELVRRATSFAGEQAQDVPDVEAEPTLDPETALAVQEDGETE